MIGPDTQAVGGRVQDSRCWRCFGRGAGCVCVGRSNFHRQQDYRYPYGPAGQPGAGDGPGGVDWRMRFHIERRSPDFSAQLCPEGADKQTCTDLLFVLTRSSHGLRIHPTMSSISSVGSSASNSAAIYQQYIAQQRAQKQANTVNTPPAQQTKAPKAVAAPAGDVDHDGDSH